MQVPKRAWSSIALPADGSADDLIFVLVRDAPLHPASSSRAQMEPPTRKVLPVLPRPYPLFVRMCRSEMTATNSPQAKDRPKTGQRPAKRQRKHGTERAEPRRYRGDQKIETWWIKEQLQAQGQMALRRESLFSVGPQKRHSLGPTRGSQSDASIGPSV